MKEVVFAIWLGIQGCLDFKYKEIPIWLSLLGGGIGVLFCVIEERNIRNMLIACVPGIIVLIFSWITKEVIGYGDGMVLLVMGAYMPIAQILSIGMLAFCLAGIVALILLVLFRKKGKEQIPFIPFLFIAYGLEYVTKVEGIL